MFALSASASMVLPDRPFLERVRLLHDTGLGVGLWDPHVLDFDSLLGTGARITIIDGFTTGNIAQKTAASAMIASAEAMIPIARRLGRPLMNLHGAKLTAAGPAAVPVTDTDEAMFETAYATLSQLAELAERHNVVFGLENLNAYDHPGVPFARGEEVVALVRRVDNPHLRVNLDVYHAARGGEDCLGLVDEVAGGLAAEVQLADSPSREWPGGRLLDFAAVRDRLAAGGYRGSVALEAWIRTDVAEALDEFVTLFGENTDDVAAR
jgi:hydroxypyruvate isomerase